MYTVQLYSGHRVYSVYSAVQAAPTGSGVTRVRAGQSGDRHRRVSRHRAQADIGHLIASHTDNTDIGTIYHQDNFYQMERLLFS